MEPYQQKAWDYFYERRHLWISKYKKTLKRLEENKKLEYDDIVQEVCYFVYSCIIHKYSHEKATESNKNLECNPVYLFKCVGSALMRIRPFKHTIRECKYKSINEKVYENRRERKHRHIEAENAEQLSNIIKDILNKYWRSSSMKKTIKMYYLSDLDMTMQDVADIKGCRKQYVCISVMHFKNYLFKLYPTYNHLYERHVIYGTV